MASLFNQAQQIHRARLEKGSHARAKMICYSPPPGQRGSTRDPNILSVHLNMSISWHH